MLRMYNFKGKILSFDSVCFTLSYRTKGDPVGVYADFVLVVLISRIPFLTPLFGLLVLEFL